jgi:predicted alpha/beta-hydrolase family hydrolase
MSAHGQRDVRIELQSGAPVSGLLLLPPGATHLLVFGHGAGAGMRHPFMHGVADRLAARGIGTLRYQFPYTEHGRSRPDSRDILLGTVESAVSAARELGEGRPLLAGGKSMGGRMSSLAAAEGMLADVRALVFFGFPLHPAGRPGTERGDHLSRVAVPMLFMQGTRDTLAELTLLRPICERLGGRATLHIIEGADHGFHVRKSAGRTDADVLDELADTVQSWAAALGV